MATAEQLKMLIRSHFNKDEDQFRTAVIQMAAHEAKLGHSELAREIRDILDKVKLSSGKVVPFNKELSDLIQAVQPNQRFKELVVKADIKERLERIITEFYKQDKLKSFGLSNRRKLLLAGPPGTGKTMTAAVLANELQLPLCTIMVDKLVTKFMGETSAKLRQIFDSIRDNQAVYLFDEFDAIGSERSMDNDVGEMRRVLNSFLQFIEQDDSNSMIIAATNNAKMLDSALFRRFDDVLHYDLPDDEAVITLIRNRMGTFSPEKLNYTYIHEMSGSLSHAEIAQACDDAIKEAILSDQLRINEDTLVKMMNERKNAYHRR